MYHILPGLQNISLDQWQDRLTVLSLTLATTKHDTISKTSPKISTFLHITLLVPNMNYKQLSWGWLYSLPTNLAASILPASLLWEPDRAFTNIKQVTPHGLKIHQGLPNPLRIKLRFPSLSYKSLYKSRLHSVPFTSKLALTLRVFC